MSDQSPRFWFPAKRYGWGWGPPKCWQGWVVMFIYAALLIVSAIVCLPSDDIVTFLGCAIVLTLLLVLVCWLKGEPPRWRSGDE